MYKPLIRTFFNFAQAVSARFASGSDVFVARKLTNEMMSFSAGTANTFRLSELPVYPSICFQGFGEQHRLDQIEASCADLSKRLADIRNLAERILNAVSPVMRSHQITDPVVSDFLFESPVMPNHVDGDLFDLNICPPIEAEPHISGEVIRQLLAAKSFGMLVGRDRAPKFQIFAGEVNPMLNGAYQ